MIRVDANLILPFIYFIKFVPNYCVPRSKYQKGHKLLPENLTSHNYSTRSRNHTQQTLWVIKTGLEIRFFVVRINLGNRKIAHVDKLLNSKNSAWIIPSPVFAQFKVSLELCLVYKCLAIRHLFISTSVWKLAFWCGLQFMMRLKSGPAPHPAVNDVWKSLSMGNLNEILDFKTPTL